MLAVVAIVAIIAFAVGFFARSLLASQAIRVAQDKAARIVAEARAQQKELILQAKDEQMRMQRELDEEGQDEARRSGRRSSGACCSVTSNPTSVRTCSRSATASC